MKRLLTVTMSTISAATLALWVAGPAQAHDVYTDQTPPPPKEFQPPRPRDGYVWAPGFWDWNGKNFHWVSGTWLVERRARHWVADHWEQSDARWHFVAGRWEQAPLNEAHR
jgi:hypothetical protein